uniref:Probable disease resistance protein At1g61300 n=1 Tax=Momordica charantia TaxID=3673 RepID=A0A6J1D9T1_MOMCH
MLDSQVETTQLQDGLKLFSKLKSLKLSGSLIYNSSHLPIEIVRIVHNLERFELRRMLVKEIFPNEKLINVEEYRNIRFEPSDLSLFELPKLKHFWKDDYKSTSSLKNLASLIISGCGILDMLVPSSVSFRNLSKLEVDKCHRLTHLLNPSVARTLVQLKRLVLKDCKRMTTVIAEVVEEGNEEIVFSRLKYLFLEDLSKLTSFHSGKCIIRFPYLDDVTIWTCPKMEVFSLGIISTTNLLVRDLRIHHGIKGSRYGYEDSNYGYEDSKVVEDINGIIRQAWEDIYGIIQQAWEDNYDTGIQYLFTEKNLEENQSDHSSSCVEE